jgi:hypothetical protein
MLTEKANDTVVPIGLTGAHHFLVGQDREGHWLAVETHGLGGGIFRTCRDALHYAAAETGRRPDAVRLADTTLALAP